MHGSGTIYMKIESPTRKNDNYSVTVTDTGHGMAVEKLSRVFEPFFTTKKNGGGIGLCIAERIVREHNGHIQIVSQEGKGTSVTVVIPSEQGVRQPGRKAPQAGPPGPGPGFAEPGVALSETLSQDPNSRRRRDSQPL
jgi:K+-sensing histidine kinase KdpD